MTPDGTTSRTLPWPPPGEASKELISARNMAHTALTAAERADVAAKKARTEARRALAHYENLLLEASGQGTLL